MVPIHLSCKSALLMLNSFSAFWYCDSWESFHVIQIYEIFSKFTLSVGNLLYWGKLWMINPSRSALHCKKGLPRLLATNWTLIKAWEVLWKDYRSLGWLVLQLLQCSEKIPEADSAMKRLLGKEEAFVKPLQLLPSLPQGCLRHEDQPGGFMQCLNHLLKQDWTFSSNWVWYISQNSRLKGRNRRKFLISQLSLTLKFCYLWMHFLMAVNIKKTINLKILPEVVG